LVPIPRDLFLWAWIVPAYVFCAYFLSQEKMEGVADLLCLEMKSLFTSDPY
jgi:hypothetical protein